MLAKTAATLGMLVFPLVPLAAQDDVNTAAQDPAADKVDPDIQRIRKLIEQADDQRKAGKSEDARGLVSRALNACLELAGFAERKDAHDLLLAIGQAAYDAGDLLTAGDAWQRVYGYRMRTLADDHPDLQRARGNLAAQKYASGDLSGALELQQKVYEVWSRALADDAPDLQRARLGLAATMSRLGDLRAACELKEKVFETWSRTLADDHPDLQMARQSLAATKHKLGDHAGAHALLETVYRIRSLSLADAHPDLQKARLGLAATKEALGDLSGARQLAEKACEVFSRTLPDDHPDLQVARQNLANIRSRLGDLQGARALQEKVYEVWRRKQPDDHVDLQAARHNLALTKKALGDLSGARVLQERVYEVWSRTLPDDHSDLQAARNNLALTKSNLGDLQGARALQEKVYEVWRRELPDDHVDLQAARLNLANTRSELGDLIGARGLQERVHEVWSRVLTEDHPFLSAARLDLANTLSALDDLAGARALQEKVCETCSRTLPDDHPDLQRARSNLAGTLYALGDLSGALALQERVYEVRVRWLPDDHPDLQRARWDLALTKRALGDPVGALELARQRSDAACRRVSAWTLAPRELGAVAVQEQEAVDLLLTLGLDDTSAKQDAVSVGLVLSQVLRGLETRAMRTLRRARSADMERSARIESELRAVAAEVTRVAGEELQGDDHVLDAKRRQRAERLADVVHEKERLERELLALAAQGGRTIAANAGVPELAAAIPEDSAAAAIVAFSYAFRDPRQGRAIDDARLTALVLRRKGPVLMVPLGPVADVQALVDTVRQTGRSQSVRGLSPGNATSGDARVFAEAAARLADRIFAPLLAACGPIATLYLSVDDLLELVPLDALPLDSRTLIGERVAVRPLVSLFELLEPPGAEPSDTPQLLVGGGIDYGRAADDAARLVDSDATGASVQSGGETAGWAPLPGTQHETSEVAAWFTRVFPNGKAQRFEKERAGKAQITAAAPRATFMHLATHGYFAPESVRSVADTRPGEGAISGLSPLALCGLALSGANLPPDDLGRHAGIITAEEILSLDLSACHLVTLSACDTSLGVRRAGQGYASLRSALLGAGARYVLTSLWKVGDEATMELMVDFYRRLWVERKDRHEALWEAKMAARNKGMAFRDWAGWVLTGR